MAVGKFYYAITSQSILVNRCIVNEKNNKVAEKKQQRNEKKLCGVGFKNFRIACGMEQNAIDRRTTHENGAKN